MSDKKDSRQKLKQDLQSLEIGEAEPPLKSAFASLGVSALHAPEMNRPETGADVRSPKIGKDAGKTRQGKQAN